MIDVILGLQWGDEGKGKIADYLTPKYDLVARFQGGPNAGHSLEFEGKKFVFVLQGEDQFQRRDVQVGMTSDQSVMIKQGLREGETIVTAGGFILKSQLLAELMGEE